MTLIRQGLVILLITLVLAELGLRLLHHFQPLFIFYDESYNRYRREPGAMDIDIRVNSMGFKDLEFGPKQEDRYRIIGLGDSFAYGNVPYKHNYLTLVEDRLSAHASYEVLNMGIPGIGPRHYLSLFVREALDLDPDMVVLSFFIGNDILETRLGDEEVDWRRWSYLWALIDYLVLVLPGLEPPEKLRGYAADFTEYCDDCPTLTERRFYAVQKLRARIFFTNVTKTPRQVDRALQYLTGIRDICETRDIRFLVVLLPDQLQVDPEHAEYVVQRGYAEYAQYWDAQLPNRLIKERLERSGIDYVDLLEPFRATARSGERLYIPRNTHWNIAGNQLAAKLITDRILEISGDRTPVAE